MSELRRPIGVFDSGVGGLTVVAALLRRVPDAEVLYVADQAHVPYGDRPLAEIHGFATGISEFLAREGCRAVVMACNVSSATALASVRDSFAPLPVLGVIGGAAQRAAVGHLPRIGVLATAGTVRSGAYTAQIHAHNPYARVIEVACPRFVPLVEAGQTETPEARQAACEYFTPLAQAGCRTIILGCTHYPFLLGTLRRVAADLFDDPVAFLDPAEETARQVAALVATERETWKGERVLLTTGSVDVLRAQAPRFLPGVDCRVEAACWAGPGRLQRRRDLIAVS